MLEIIVVVVLGLILCLVLSANNASICFGTSVGTGIISYVRASILVSVGLLLGLFAEGTKLFQAVPNGILANISYSSIVAIYIASICIVVAATIWRLPLAISSAIVGASVGAGLAFQGGINWGYTGIVFLSWVLTPLIAFVVSIFANLLILRIGSRIKGVVSYHLLTKWLNLISVFYVSYVLGANTLGLVSGMINSFAGNTLTVLAIFGIASVIGVFFFSAGVARTVGSEILDLGTTTALAAQLGGALTIHLFTQFRLPVPVSEAVVGGVVGVGYSRRIALINRPLIRKILFGWLASPLVGVLIAYLLSFFL